MNTVLQGLCRAFSLKSEQLRQAVSQGEDDLVRLVDRELGPIVCDIISYRASTRAELWIQLQFLSELIRSEADDRSAVLRRTSALSALIDKYFLDNDAGSDPQSLVSSDWKDKPSSQGVQDQSLFNEAILDSLDDRVGVITTDYRYLYTNQANARVLRRSVLSMIGCHVSEFIGEESFRTQAKPAFDRCFAGEKIDYVHRGYRNKQKFSTRCRMTPLRTPSSQIIGAVIVLQNAEEMVTLERG